MRRLIVGCGYLGCRVAQRWRDHGDTVFVMTRDSTRATDLSTAGFHPLVADVTRPDQLQDLPDVDTVLFAVGYDRSSGKAIEEVYVAGLQNVINSLPAGPQFVYISSVGVYGQQDGSWVDEQSACEPTRPGGAACLAAEKILAASRFSANSIVLRLAGIYGPGRVPLADKIRSGEPIPSPPAGYLNLIHVDDAADIVCVVADEPMAGNIYCVADNHPIVRRDYYDHLARLLDAPLPTYASVSDSGSLRRRGASNKRVRNERLMTNFDIALAYPSYREGLAAGV